MPYNQDFSQSNELDEQQKTSQNPALEIHNNDLIFSMYEKELRAKIKNQTNISLENKKEATKSKE